MRFLLIQPPFVQLNAPYPAVHCLDRFLRDRGHDTVVRDDSAGLYRELMAPRSVRRILSDAETALKARPAPDPETALQTARYLSYRDRWVEWAEPLARFLSGGDPALAFRLSRVPDDLPLGRRAETFLEEREGLLKPEDAPALAIRILDDLGDLVAYALDPDFGTVRYAERIASSRAEYGPISEAAESGYLMREFYRPRLREEFRALSAPVPDFALLTVPFPGCLAGAVAAAREVRRAFGPGVRIALGGGYVSTELRRLRDASVFSDIDYLCFDAGYGALASLIEGAEAERAGRPVPAPYRTARRAPDGEVEYCGQPPEDDADPAGIRRTPCPDGDRFASLEEEALRSTFPDYRNADFGSCVRAPYSDNPMHRIWSDPPWLKYQLAYGCYWHRCSFCDTRLDYVRRYLPSDPGALFDAARAARDRTGLSGIHFTDEALPLPGLLEFARRNRAEGRPFSFWGNVRFDRVWTADRCALLAASGLTAVSGGIEIATDRGLAMTGKGFTFPDLVRALAAFKRAGVLVHGYLIYGFPAQTPGDLVDSAEAVRQLFAAGLLDSAFWHRFVLTRHSELYARWRTGKEPDLQPVDRGGNFATNDLEFRGSERWDPYDGPLEALLADWMAGKGLDRPVRPLVPGGPGPSLAPDRVGTLARAAAEHPYEGEVLPARPRVHWLAGLPALTAVRASSGGRAASARTAAGGLARVEWFDRGRPAGIDLPRPGAERLAEALAALARRPDGMDPDEFLAAAGAVGAGDGLLTALRGEGLVLV
ncbi:MAG TPA: radical SAM protein [Spirochaetia bacterium]|nr:radical SAM protein [Spirochaetales bacterium]HRY79573.1 radical SAM protein [Spirochaetia bacterium]HRZ88745.1 radical SAM protein [Spirochaetia bacterium]